MRVGAHIPVASGYPAAVRYAVETGCECAQVFAKSPRQWEGRQLDPEAADSFAAELERHGVVPLFTHTAYLINLGSEDDVLWTRSILALADELIRASVLRAAGVVTHVGTNPTGRVRRAVDRVAGAVSQAFERAGVTTHLLLENTAGAGRTFGGSPEELGTLVGRLRQRGLPVGVCLDTCHLHAWGIDLAGETGWREALDRFDRSCGIASVELVHANDCAFSAGSKRDRHAWIGAGTIGDSGFRAMFAQERLSDVPAVIEMPGEPPEKDRENLAVLKRLRSEATP